MSNIRYYEILRLLKFSNPGELQQMVSNIGCENDLQATLMHYLDTRGVLAYAVPNGSYKSRPAAALFKHTGLKAGVPDIHIPIASNGYHSMYIELKYKSNNLQQSQKAWIKDLTHYKNYVVVHRHLIEAIKDVDQYLNLKAIVS